MATASCIYFIWFLLILFTSEACEEPMDAGPCHDSITRWAYDKESDSCTSFIYGGCGGNDKNNFYSQLACEQKCLKSNRDGAVCSLPKDVGSCRASVSQWFYDNKEGVCKPFTYGGCDGNGNKFDSKEECELRCGNVQAGPTVFSSDYYTITTKKKNSNRGFCQEEIRIKGNDDQATRVINDIFQAPCKAGGDREVYCLGREALVGDPNQDFCIFTHLGIPNQVIVVRGGKCSIKMFGGRFRNNGKTLRPQNCGKVKKIINDVKGILENTDIMTRGKEISANLTISKDELEKILETAEEDVSATSTSPNTVSQTSGGHIYTNKVTASPAPPQQEKKPGLFERVLNKIKSVF